MTTRFATPAEITTWSDQVLANADGGNIFQSQEFADQKQAGGWTPRYVMADETAILLLEKNVPLLGKFWYAPKGPGVTTADQLQAILPDLRELAQKSGVFTIKIEPEIPMTPAVEQTLSNLGLVQVAPIQPNSSTIVIDISGTADEVLATFSQSARRSIRRGIKDGVTISAVQATEENCRSMYEMTQATSEGQFSIRPYDYYKTMWQQFSHQGIGQLMFAYHDGQPIAGIFVTFFGNKALYKDGASLRQKKAQGVGHLIQSETITFLKTKGVTSYDLHGTPPASQMDNKDHKFYRLGIFKSSFNKQVIDYVGAYDLPVNAKKYRIWTKIGQRIVRSLSVRLHHTDWY